MAFTEESALPQIELSKNRRMKNGVGDFSHGALYFVVGLIVSDVGVNYKSGIAEVNYDPTRTSADELAKAVTTVGYPTNMKGVH